VYCPSFLFLVKCSVKSLILIHFSQATVNQPLFCFSCLKFLTTWIKDICGTKAVMKIFTYNSRQRTQHLLNILHLSIKTCLQRVRQWSNMGLLVMLIHNMTKYWEIKRRRTEHGTSLPTPKLMQKKLLKQTEWPTPCSKVILEKLTFSQLVSYHLYGKLIFITVFTVAKHWTNSSTRRIQSTISHAIAVRSHIHITLPQASHMVSSIQVHFCYVIHPPIMIAAINK